MPTLDWIGKKAVVEHHKQVPFHLLRCNDALSVGEPGSGNLLVQGDNLIALKALLPYYTGQVKCIYIDPPYNTGNENWVYNDNTNSPEIRDWLGKTVGKEAEDLSRHDKWLCMMYPRLALLREFLREDGAIFLSIDDNEVHNLRCILDEIFGPRNFVANVIWQKRTSPDARIHLGPAHDHILVYGKTLKSQFNKLNTTPEQAKNFKNPDNDVRGPWASTDFTAQGWRPNQMYKLRTPKGIEYEPPPGRCWANIEGEYKRLCSEDRIWFGKDGKARPRVKNFLSETMGMSSWTWWPNTEVGHNQEAKKEINAIIGGDTPFDTPKPVRLIRRILEIASDKDSIILDSFAGSGTTAHAVLALNKEDGGTRRFVLVEMEPGICREITAQRLSRAIQGYNNIPPLGGGYRFCDLGEPLFSADGQIDEDRVTFEDLAHHVFFIATGEPLPHGSDLKSPLLGVSNGVAVYLLYNGIMGDRSVNGGNVLTRNVLASLPFHLGTKIIYGNGCRISAERLRRENIIFRQVPYEVRAS
jgi:adenine-specific DNA-methyltransferase